MDPLYDCVAACHHCGGADHQLADWAGVSKPTFALFTMPAATATAVCLLCYQSRWRRRKHIGPLVYSHLLLPGVFTPLFGPPGLQNCEFEICVCLNIITYLALYSGGGGTTPTSTKIKTQHFLDKRVFFFLHIILQYFYLY